MKTSIRASLASSAMVAVFLLSGTLPAAATHKPPLTPPIFLPVGSACPDFNVELDWTGGNLHEKEWLDANGEVVRSITAGKGVLLTYTNYGPDPDEPVQGKSVTLKTGGAVVRMEVAPDGTEIYTATGHSGLVMFPSDVPAGPSITQYNGRVVYEVDPKTGVFTLISATGRSRNICAELD